MPLSFNTSNSSTLRCCVWTSDVTWRHTKTIHYLATHQVMKLCVCVYVNKMRYLHKVGKKSCSCAFFNWAPHHAEGVEVQLHAFLTSALDGGEWSASRTGRFIPRERAPSAHWIRGWLDPRAGLDAVERRKIPSPCRDSNPRSSSSYRSPIPLSYYPPSRYSINVVFVIFLHKCEE
jgi:hypothetical protein